MTKKVLSDIKKKNPLKPVIAKKSINLARKASQGEFRRSDKLSQKAHSSLLAKPS